MAMDKHTLIIIQLILIEDFSLFILCFKVLLFLFLVSDFQADAETIGADSFNSFNLGETFCLASLINSSARCLV